MEIRSAGATQIRADRLAEREPKTKRKMRETRRMFNFNKQGRDIIGENKIQKKKDKRNYIYKEEEKYKRQKEDRA